MVKFFPFLDWLLHYRKENLNGDLTAGFTVGVMLIPQGMALALLADLPPIIGLYAAVASLPAYAIFGTSRQLSVGPMAIVSLLVVAGLSRFAEPGSADYIRYATILAAMVGTIQFLMGISRFGFLVNFLSHPVISGFMSAAAVIIVFSQLDNLLGIDVPRSPYIHQMIVETSKHIGEVNLPTVLIGVISIIVLLLLQHWKATFPRALLMVAITSFIVWILNLENFGVRVMGYVPKGLHPMEIPKATMATISDLLPIAVAISLIGFMESVAVAKVMAQKHHHEVDANQELIGLGFANFAASFFGGFPVSGGFSRTAVNAEAGARTGLASLITASIILCTLLFFTKLFHYMPIAVLAAIIIVAASSLVDWQEARHLFKVKRTDFASLVFTFFATLILGIEWGLILSIAVSLIFVVQRTTHPNYAILGRLPGTKIYRNIERYPEAITLNGLVMIRIDASLYFANVEFLKDRVQEIVKNYPNKLSTVVFDASSVNDIDSSADMALHEIAQNLKARNIELYFTNVKGPVRDVMHRCGFYDLVGEDHFFFSNHDAVRHYLDKYAEADEIQKTKPVKRHKRKITEKE